MTDRSQSTDDDAGTDIELTEGLRKYELSDDRPLRGQLLETIEETTRAAKTRSAPLYETLDVEHLEGLLETGDDERLDVTFTFEGWQFEVHGRETVLAIRKPPSGAEESVRG